MNYQSTSVAAAGLIITAALAACGGGGETTTSSTTTTLSGTAATGSAFAGADVSVIDKTGTVVGTGKTGEDGSYNITLSAGASAPFVLQAVRDDMTLTSVAPDTTNTTLNITPVTDLIASRLTASGDPKKLAAEFKADPNLLTAGKINTKVDEVVTLVKPLLDAVGTNANPLTTKFSADGTGIDRALDSLLVKITPESTTASNIEVGVKQLTAEGAQPTVVQFTNSTTDIGTLPTINSSNLLPNGTAPLIADLMKRVTACFALPAAERVNTPDVQAAATDIKAAACKTIFHNNDPASYKNNGFSVTNDKDLSEIFKTSGNGIVFDRGVYEFTRANGDMFIGYRMTDSRGNVNNLGMMVRLSTADNRLRIVGNQYDYDGAVVAYHQKRTYINQPAANFYSTGYNLLVTNNGLLSKVVVTTPKGNSLTLVPVAGATYLYLQKNGAPSVTSFLRVRTAFADPSNNANPADFDSGIVLDPSRPSEAAIASYPQQGTWRFDYYLLANPNAIAATQYYKTRARAMTIGELKTQGFADLTQTKIAELQAGSQSGFYSMSTTAPLTLDWTVPTGVLEPTSIRTFGLGPIVNNARARFDDGVSVKSTARQGSIPCERKTQTDSHCTVVNGTTNYAAGTTADSVHLASRDHTGRFFAHLYATFKMAL
jgi:hypothetical protein